jgi:hypothetical protein
MREYIKSNYKLTIVFSGMKTFSVHVQFAPFGVLWRKIWVCKGRPRDTKKNLVKIGLY